MAYTPENNPYIPGDPYSYDLKWIVNHVKNLDTVISTLDERIADAVRKAFDESEPIYYSTVQNMIDGDQNPGSLALVLGYYAAGDNGSNLFYITDDYNDIIGRDFYITISANKWAIPIILSPFVYPEMFGAKGDETTPDDVPLQLAINHAKELNGSVILTKLYAIENPLTVYTDSKITGSGNVLKTGIKAIETIESCFLVEKITGQAAAYRVNLTNFSIFCNDKADYGIYSDNISESTFEQLRIEHALIDDICIGNGWGNRIYNCALFYAAEAALRLILGNNHNLSIEDTDLGYSKYGLLSIANASVINVRGCVIEGNSDCGIYLSAYSNAVISGCYFENNGNDANPITDLTQHANVIINGSSDISQYGRAYPCDTVSIENCSFSVNNNNYAVIPLSVHNFTMMNCRFSNTKPVFIPFSLNNTSVLFGRYSITNCSYNGDLIEYNEFIDAYSSGAYGNLIDEPFIKTDRSLENNFLADSVVQAFTSTDPEISVTTENNSNALVFTNDASTSADATTGMTVASVPGLKNRLVRFTADIDSTGATIRATYTTADKAVRYTNTTGNKLCNLFRVPDTGNIVLTFRKQGTGAVTVYNMKLEVIQ